MREFPLEPLPAEIAALLDQEKDAYREHAALKAAVYERVETALVLTAPGPFKAGSAGAGTLGRAGAGAGAAAAKAVAVWKLVAVGLSAFVAGGIVGGTAVKQAPQLPIPQPPPLVGAPTVASNSRIPEPAPSSPPALSTPRPPAAVAQSSRASTSALPPANSAGDLTRERELLDVARAALARGSPDDAISAARQHASKWPHGYLAEEREVVLIQALVAAGRRDDAERHAARFPKDFPGSMLTSAVDAAVRGKDPTP